MAPGARASVCVVVLNWNNASDTLACLSSLQASAIPVDALVVDNGSTDGSREQIELSGLASVVIATGENLGFAGGNNRGIARAIQCEYRYIVVLNNDTLVAPDTFVALSVVLERATRPVAVSPDIRFATEPMRSWFAGGVYDRGLPVHAQPESLGEKHRGAEPYRTGWLSGCCIAATRATWQRVGLFDADYFLIFEDVEWSERARGCGVELLVVPQARVLHKVSSSIELDGGLLGAFYFSRNGLRLLLGSGAERRTRAGGLRFMRHWLLRPGMLRSQQRLRLLFHWLGALSLLVNSRGRAPGVIEALARQLSATKAGQGR